MTAPPRSDVSRGLRAVETIAGLLSAGLIVIGGALIIAQIAVPEMTHGVGFAAASGPGWGRSLAQFGVGAAGECICVIRRSLPGWLRVIAASAVVVAGLAVTYAAWWA